MGEYVRPPYKQLNRETGKWELVTPKPIEFTTEKDTFHPVDVKTQRVYKELKKRKK